MKQFEFELSEIDQRPVITLRSWYNVSALIDTGAVFPVWTKEELSLRIGSRNFEPVGQNSSAG